MDPRQLTRLFAAARIGVGLALLVAPRTAIGLWLGRARASPATDAVARGLGARDLAIGLGLVRSLGEDASGSGEHVGRWLDAAALADATDATAVLLGRRHLEPLTIVGTAAVAGAAAAGALILKKALAPG